MAFLGRRGKRSAPRAQPGNGRCGCGRGIPAGRVFCPSCATENGKGHAVALTGTCAAQVYRNGRREACGGNVRNGVCPSPDH